MSSYYLLGVDVGSSFIKVSLFDEAGRVLAEAQVDNRPRQPQLGVSEYDADAMLGAIVRALREMLGRAQVDPAQIAALALDGMQSGTLGVGRNGEATTPYTTTLDTRFAPEMEHVMRHHEDAIRRITGAGQPCLAPKIQWIQRAFPDVYARTWRFMTIGDYLTCRLTGRTGDSLFFGATYLWMTGIGDAQNAAWSETLCDAMDIPRALLPPVISGSSVVGGVTPAIASATGLIAGTPVVAGCGDQPAGFLGAAITQPGRVADVAGTYPVLAFCTDQFRPDLGQRRTEILPSAVGGFYNPISFINGGGLTHHWFVEQFCGSSLDDGRGYSTLDAEAAAISPGANGLLFNPHLGGRACPTQTQMRGAWIGFSWAHTRAHFYRALLEAVAFDHAEALRSLQSCYPEWPITEVRVFGGGARSDLWNQIKADILGLPYVSLKRDDLGTYGVALLAGYGIGLIDSPTMVAEASVAERRRYEPDSQAHAAYRPYLEQYGELLHSLEPAYARLTLLRNEEPSPA